MRVEQTSPTTFELQTDNGCVTLAGYATETMGAPGVYVIRPDSGLTRDEAAAFFLADPRVQAAITHLTTNQTKDTKQS